LKKRQARADTCSTNARTSPACQKRAHPLFTYMRHSYTKSAPIPKSILSQFATYRTAIARVFFLTTFLIISFLAALPEVSRAQCPDSTGPAPNPDSIPWINDPMGQQYQQIPGTDCFVTYDYCERQVGDSIQVWVEDIIPDSSNACDSLTPGELIVDVDSMVAVLEASTNPLVPDCIKGFSVTVQVFQAECWEAGENPCFICIGRQSATGYFPCSFGHWCETSCECCWLYNARDATFSLQVSNCTTANTYVSDLCAPPPLGNQWAWGACFTQGCQNGGGGDVIEDNLGVQAPQTIDSSLKLFPNPASERLTVTSLQQGMPIEVLDVLGREVMTGAMPANGPLQFDVSTLPNGTYYVVEGHTELKFIKN
jgi:hypothetical protein